MRALKVNADYESVLFHSRPGQRIVNESLEFLAFFLSHQPILTQKNYSPDYLEYVTSRTGNRPHLVTSSDDVENWWGQLKNIPIEKWMNSKVTSTEFLIERQWINGHKILRTKENSFLGNDQAYLIKDPFLMSGQKFQIINPGEKLNWSGHEILVAEPLLNRKKDFSAYFYSSQKIIFYENIIDHHFHYRGTIFNDWTSPHLENLKFFDQIDPQHWKVYRQRLKQIISHYVKNTDISGFSIDAFIYFNQECLIYPLCEINYRRTMGQVAYELAETYSKDHKWAGLLLLKPARRPLWTQLPNHPHLMVLSPGDTRFEILLIMAESAQHAQEILKEVESLIILDPGILSRLFY
jgi:hypothetical protein